MPLYNYTCQNCSKMILDKLEPISAESIQDCPFCGQAKQLHRQITAPSISFSGSGWYKDGYTSSSKSSVTT